MHALITGGTGFVGRRLIARLERAVILSRRGREALAKVPGQSVDAFGWDPVLEPAPTEAFSGVSAVFHLAGEPVAGGRWTDARKKRIRDSRVLGTRNLVTTLMDLEDKPRVLISASAVGFYGDCGDRILPELAASGDGFLSDVCVAWEREAQRAQEGGIRVVNVRIGLVLGSEGGVLASMRLPFSLGMGIPLGSGNQWMPWIHIDDLVELLLYAANHDHVVGPVNATAPNPVTNRQFTKSLAAALHRPAFLPAVPAFALRFGLGEFASALLASQRAIPEAIQAAGFRFRYDELDEALQQIYC